VSVLGEHLASCARSARYSLRLATYADYSTSCTLAPMMKHKHVWLSWTIVSVGIVVAVTLSMTTAPATAVLAAHQPTAVTVDLTGGATMTVPTMRAGDVVFDLTVPPVPAGEFVTPLGWYTSDTYWEVVVDSTSVYVQWQRGRANGLKVLSGQVDDGHVHRVRVDTQHSGPIVSVVLNPVSH